MGMIEADTRDDRLIPGELEEARMSYPLSHADHQEHDGRPSGAGYLLDDLDIGDLASAGTEQHETDPQVRTELAGSLHFILSQYLRPSTLRRLIGPREGMIGRVMLGRSMQGEIDDDLLARVLAQAVIEHIRQSGFVVQRRQTA